MSTIMSATKTKQTETYIVRRPFDHYKIGDEFDPTGKRNGALLVEYYCDIVYNDKQSNTRGKTREAK
jgi:hypothetical protein